MEGARAHGSESERCDPVLAGCRPELGAVGETRLRSKHGPVASESFGAPDRPELGFWYFGMCRINKHPHVPDAGRLDGCEVFNGRRHGGIQTPMPGAGHAFPVVVYTMMPWAGLRPVCVGYPLARQTALRSMDLNNPTSLPERRNSSAKSNAMAAFDSLLAQAMS